MEDKPASTPTPQQPRKLTIPLDYRLLSVVLTIVILAMLLLWKPWQPGIDANTRTVKVTGETTISAEPDEFVFRPVYQFFNNDKGAAIKAAQDKETELVAAIKRLNIKDSQIKTHVDGFQNKRGPGIEPALPGGDSTEEYVYTLNVTVTLTDRGKAQQLQDYLATTQPLGGVSPMPQFSTAMRKQLETKARQEATRDARTRADQSASNLGFSVKAVKSVTDGAGFGVMPFATGAADMRAQSSATPAGAPVTSPSLMPGEQDYPYSVTVEYYIK